MNNKELLEYISLFREKAEHGKLVIFVGAGVSCNVDGMPDWNSLIQKMAEAIGYSKCSYCRHRDATCEQTCKLKNEYSADEFLKIPQYVFNKNEASYFQVLAESISTVVADAPLSSAIFDLNPAHIITTNYDQLLETSANIFCEQYQVIVHDKDLLNTDKSKYIIKMHGDLSELDSIVLKEQDYLDYSQNHILIELFIKSLLTDHTVLFLGYSLNDYNIKLILSWLNYMRSQNGLDKNRRIGYILLDQEDVDDTQQSYFSSNNIDVININSLSQVQDIPETLLNEKGKRLYSFLRIIANPALEEGIASIEYSIQFMARYVFISYEHILKLLYIKKYEVKDWKLHLFLESDYTRLTNFMESSNEGATKLKQIFLNAGIISLHYFALGNSKHYSIGKLSDNILLQSKLYNLYLSNKYDEIKALLDDDSNSFITNEKCFYLSICGGYPGILENYRKVNLSELSTEQKVTYLHNLAVLEAMQTFSFDSTKVCQFIQNIASSRERELFSGYSDIYNGNTRKRFAMQEALDKLKKNMNPRNSIHMSGTSCTRIYEIQRLAITQYFFYFNNHILFQGFSDLKEFFRPYIESIICSNCEVVENVQYWEGVKFTKETYFINYLDIDIMSKFISTKDLNAFIAVYNIKRLNIGENEVAFLIDCFKNLCSALITARTYGFRESTFSTLSNLILLLNFVNLSEKDKEILSNSIRKLLSDETLTHTLFSINWPDFRDTLEGLSKLCQSLKFSCDYEIVQHIISGTGFFDFAVNVNFNSLRHLVMSFLSKDISANLQATIDKAEDFDKKVILIRLFYQYIDNQSAKTYINFLSENFWQLPTNAIYDFALSGWLTLAPQMSDTFLKGILDLKTHLSPGIYRFPDPLETKLECAYILHISDIIPDISLLCELAEGRPHLQFLLEPDNFDYAQVDFSNYMWENFARQDKYRKHFIAHKDEIIPQIRERIEKDIASEAEKKILYGFLLDKNDIWKM